MRTISKVIVSVLFVSLLSGCQYLNSFTNSASGSSASSSSEQTNSLCILSINDLHGAIEADDSYKGLARVATVVNKNRERYGKDNTILLCAGDAFQGSIVSNLTAGRAVVEAMNEMDFDQMTIGNHEFDWGIDKIANYFDGETSNGEANFPMGSANIYHKTTNQRFSWTDEYTIVEKAGLKVGIIPTIGYKLESDILGTRVADYTFKEPVAIIKSLAKKLRSEEKCDVVIVNSHDDGEYIDEKIAEFGSESYVDAVINGHSHARNKDMISRPGVDLATVEAGSSGSHVGKIVLSLSASKKVTDASSLLVEVLSSDAVNPDVNRVVSAQSASISSIADSRVAIVGETISSKSQLYKWAGQVIQKGLDCDIGITNTGGLRSIGNGFVKDKEWTIRDLYALNPFDNCIMSVEMLGSTFVDWMNQYSSGSIISYRDGLSQMNIVSTQTYRVCVIDYLSEKDYNAQFFKNETYVTTGYVLRDLMQIDMMTADANNGSWKPSLGATYTPTDIENYYKGGNS